MKILTALMLICSVGLSTVCQAQTDQEVTKTDTIKQMSLLDEQTKMFSQIFDMAGASEENLLGGATNYSEATKQMD